MDLERGQAHLPNLQINARPFGLLYSLGSDWDFKTLLFRHIDPTIASGNARLVGRSFNVTCNSFSHAFIED